MFSSSPRVPSARARYLEDDPSIIWVDIVLVARVSDSRRLMRNKAWATYVIP
mgnify:CR=1 FL=1